MRIFLRYAELCGAGEKLTHVIVLQGNTGHQAHQAHPNEPTAIAKLTRSRTEGTTQAYSKHAASRIDFDRCDIVLIGLDPTSSIIVLATFLYIVHFNGFLLPAYVCIVTVYVCD
jgi:hypothetical protein